MTKRGALLTGVFMAVVASSVVDAQRPAASNIPDLSGAWLGRPPMMSISSIDTGGQQRGKEPDIAYQPWALEKLLAEVPPTGPFGVPDRTTDPWIRYCEANGPVRIYAHPGRTMFVQLPDKVLILHEVMQQFRIVRLNSTHPPADDIDPTPWGDSIGRYEDGAFIVDTIGLDGRAWLDQAGHPVSDKEHVIERYRRLDKDKLEWQVTIDDPGAYQKPITLTRVLPRSDLPFMQSPWNCSVRDNTAFTDKLLKEAGAR